MGPAKPEANLKVETGGFIGKVFIRHLDIAVFLLKIVAHGITTSI